MTIRKMLHSQICFNFAFNHHRMIVEPNFGGVSSKSAWHYCVELLFQSENFTIHDSGSSSNIPLESGLHY